MTDTFRHRLSVLKELRGRQEEDPRVGSEILDWLRSDTHPFGSLWEVVDRLGAQPKLDADWFDEVEDMLDDYSDAEIIDGTTHPNKAMRLLCQLREARS